MGVTIRHNSTMMDVYMFIAGVDDSLRTLEGGRAITHP